jgi:uncharacterized protein (TIGR03435 family)
MTRTILLLCLAHRLVGQSFEVASIKPHAGMATRVGTLISGSRMTFMAMSIENVISYAYELKSYQITGTPSWAKTDRWDITAKAEGDGVLGKDQAKQMTQTLLAERCGLKVHREQRELSVYVLVPAKSGPKLKESPPEARDALRMSGNQTLRITTTKGSMKRLADQLSVKLDRPVVDETGLAGNYDYTLEWKPDGAVAEDSSAPSIFAAVEEQLGLKLEPKKASVETMVIDHVTKPSEN